MIYKELKNTELKNNYEVNMKINNIEPQNYHPTHFFYDYVIMYVYTCFNNLMNAWPPLT